jgi:heat shock protein HslJ
MRFFTLMTGLLLALTACATGAAASLDGTTWDITEINGTAPVAGSHPTMTFTGDRVGVATGCNSMSAGYTLNGTAITISGGAMTAMACADDLMTQESKLTAALAKVTKLSLSGDTMQLQDASGQTLVTLTKAAPATPKPLEQTTWQLESIRTGQSVSSVVSGTTVTMQISGGKLSGKACNTFRANVTVEGDNITVGPVMSTKMACPTEDENKQEMQVLDLLGKATSLKIEGSHLQLSTGDGDGLGFTAS